MIKLQNLIVINCKIPFSQIIFYRGNFQIYAELKIST